jgi:hypothetical protein
MTSFVPTRSAYLDYNLFNLYVAMFDNDNVVTDEVKLIHGSHLGWRSWSPDTILKVYYSRTIHAMFALNWLTGFRREDF